MVAALLGVALLVGATEPTHTVAQVAGPPSGPTAPDPPEPPEGPSLPPDASTEAAPDAAPALTPLLAVIVDAAELGLTGAGVTVAVIDSGMDTTHPALAGAVMAEFCFELNGAEQALGDNTGRCPNSTKSQQGTGSAVDTLTPSATEPP